MPKVSDSFEKTGQQHIVNYIRENGDIGAKFDDNWPLDEAQMRAPTVNGIQLLHRIELNNALSLNLLLLAASHGLREKTLSRKSCSQECGLGCCEWRWMTVTINVH